MNGIIKRGLLTVLVTGGFLALGAGVAYADDTTDGSDGTASGTQAVLGINLPITIGGNGISVLGDSSSSGSLEHRRHGRLLAQRIDERHRLAARRDAGRRRRERPGHDRRQRRSRCSATAPARARRSRVRADPATPAPRAPRARTASLGGTQVVGDVNAPITVSGNAISVAGDSFSGQSGTASGSDSDAAGGPSGTTSGDDSVAGGTQVLADAGVPVVVGGNAI